MSRQKITADREQYVVKANELIRRTRYNLTTQQQQIVLFAISKIKPGDDINTEYIFDVKELADACGMRIRESGTYYDRIKEDLVILMRRELYLMPDGVERSISWIGDVAMSKGDATVKIRFNPNMQPYLFDLREKYTQYKLQSVLAFRGKYAIRLYEILRSYTTAKAITTKKESEVDISLDELRYQLDTQSYDRWVDFNRFILLPAVKEINTCAEDIHVEYYPMRGAKGRTIERINFVITSAGMKQKTEAYIARKKKLDHEK